MINENTIWLEHHKYPGYLFSPEGSCLSLRGPSFKILKNQIKKAGYIQWHISFGLLKPKSISAHRIIAEIYCKELEGDKLLEVNHIDGNKINNHYKNLQWVTKSQNRLHSIYTLKKYSGFKKGGNHYNSKLNKEKVIEVKRLLKTGMTHSLIAIKFNVTRECITNIKNDKTWKHIIA